MSFRTEKPSAMPAMPPADDGLAARDLAACRALLANGSRTFLAASRVLPRRVRDPATALYAFCRVADDLVDGAPAGALQAARDGLARRLDAVYAPDVGDDPSLPTVDRAFARVVAAHRLPRALPDALLDGFAWDAAGRRYDSLADLEAYAARVAGSVGAMMAVLMGARSAAALARASDLGVAMQYSNIARDVGEDARAGRLYLPLAWLREAGIDADAFLAAPRFDPRLGRVVSRLLADAERLYARAAGGIGALPVDCRFGIEVARRLYASIGHAVERRGGNSVDGRAVVSPLGKARRVVEASLAAWRHAPVDAPALPATRFLVEAAAEPAGGFAARPPRVVWVLDLFERLERADRLRGTGIVAVR